MEIIETKLPGVVIIQPKIFPDARGFFLESYHALRYEQSNIDVTFVQDNLSRSTRGVLRGLHCQLEHTQGKLVYSTRGTVFDVAVDIRSGSPTFGQSVSAILDDQNHQQLYIPPGFAHGFCVLSDEADFMYKCTDYYHPASEIGVRWDDPDLKISWPITQPLLSARDQNYPRLKDIPLDKLPLYQSV
jgi:dTDP-4-dehydrorhamnose 3,5-epimerase